jgi:hypothetical protein
MRIFLLSCLLLTVTLACQRSEPQPETVTPPAPTIEVPTSRGIAPNAPPARDPFAVNEYFETFIAKNPTQTVIVELQTPAANAVLMRKGEKVKVEIRGNCLNAAEVMLNLEIFPAIFDRSSGIRPIVEQKLNLASSPRGQYFSYLQYVNLPKGLYYYFLKMDEQPIYVNKFLVQ